MDSLKVPPYSLEAEQAVLGSILSVDKGHRVIGEIFDLIRPDMFYMLTHQSIFTAMNKIGAMNEIDIITLEEELNKANETENVGGFAYLGELARNLPSSANAIKYCEMIIERYKKRIVLEILSNAENQIYDKADTDETLKYIETNLANIEAGGAYEPTHIREQIDPWLMDMQKRCDRYVDAMGIETGIPAIDEQIVGMKDWLVVLAGRPSMGKTIIAQLINSNVSRTMPSQFFSMEMSKSEIMDRYIGVLAGIAPKDLKRGTLTDYQWARTHQVLDGMSNDRYKIYYDDTPALSLAQISHRVKSTIKRVGKIGLITIDYLGLMQKEKADREDLRIAAVTRGLKSLAKETQTPILLLVQANRGADQVARPTMSNLAGSSAIESDADVVMFVHRDEVANPDTDLKGITEIIPVKFRHGDFNQTVYMKKNPDNGRFECMKISDVAITEHLNNVEKKDSFKDRFAK